MQEKTFTISKISCGHCVRTIQNELQEIDGIQKVTGDPEAKRVTVQWTEPASDDAIKAKLNEIGFPASA